MSRVGESAVPTGARYGGLSASSAVPARARLVWVERLRLPLMIGVVLIHAYDPVRATHGELISLQGRAGFSDFVMFLLSQVIGRLSVPMFFAMSGFFFATAIPWRNSEKLVSALVQRARTLLVPFLFWNILLTTMFLCLHFLGFYQPAADSRYSGLFVSSFWGLMDISLGMTGYPIAYQFWFLRDLIVVVLLCAVPLAFLSRVSLAVVTAIFGVMWLLNIWNWEIPATGSFFWLLFGCSVARWSLLESVSRLPKSLFALYVCAALSEFALVEYDWYVIFHRLILFLGVLNIYRIATYFTDGSILSGFSARHGNAAFFLFAFHEPLLTVCKKVAFLWATGPAQALGVYFFVAFFVIVVSLWAYRILDAVAPGILRFATGGR